MELERPPDLSIKLTKREGWLSPQYVITGESKHGEGYQKDFLK